MIRPAIVLSLAFVSFEATAQERAPETSGVLVTASKPDLVHDGRLGKIAAGFARRGFESFVAGDLLRPPPDANRQRIRARFRLDTARRARRKNRTAGAVAPADEAIRMFERTASEPLHAKLLVQAYVERGASAFVLGDLATAETMFLKALALDPLYEPDAELFDADMRKLFSDVARFSRQLRYGTLFVDAAETPGATISVDFGAPNDPPYETKLPDGRHFVSVRAPGRQEVVVHVQVRTERRVEVIVRPPVSGGSTAEASHVMRFDPKTPATITALSNATRMRFVLAAEPTDTNVVVTLFDGRTGAAVSGARATLSLNPTAKEIDAAVDTMLFSLVTFEPSLADDRASPWYTSWWAIAIAGSVVAAAAATTYFAVDRPDTEYRFEP